MSTQFDRIVETLQMIAVSQQQIADALDVLAMASNSETAATRTRDKSDHNAAMAAIIDGATSYASIAKATGIPASTLRGWPKVRDAVDRVGGNIPRGYKSADGDFDAWED